MESGVGRAQALALTTEAPVDRPRWYHRQRHCFLLRTAFGISYTPSSTKSRDWRWMMKWAACISMTSQQRNSCSSMKTPFRLVVLKPETHLDAQPALPWWDYLCRFRISKFKISLTWMLGGRGRSLGRKEEGGEWKTGMMKVT